MEHEKPTIVCCLYAASDLGHFPRKARSKVFLVGEKRPMEFNESAFPSKRRMLMFNETDSANGSKKNGEQYEKTAEKSGYCTEQAWKISLENDISMSRKGMSKMVQEMVPQTPSPSKWKSKNDVLNHLEKKVEPTCYTTRRRRLELNETSMANVGDRRVSFKGLKKKEKKIKEVRLNVERKAMTAWCKLLRAVPPDNVDSVWPEVLFIVKVGKIQGPRLYQPWKGSVLDSVLGALLTQRVDDDSSSSAFMSLSMNFPQDCDCDLYSRHHRILRKKRSNACSNVDSAHKMPFDEMNGRKSKKGKIPLEKEESDREVSVRDADKVDSVDWLAVMRSNVDDIAKAIFIRGMSRKLAIRIKDFLNRLVLDHGNLDLEWLRNIDPQKAKDFLLSIYGIGMKSTECVRLLTLRQPAFPVDVHVARVTVRLGWVPAPSARDDILMSLLQKNSKLHDRIHQYLSLRLSKFDKDTLYELHCQMITIWKIFCTSQKPNCSKCPMRWECRYYFELANSSSSCFQEKDIEDIGNSRRTVTKAKAAMSPKCKVKKADTDTLPDDCIDAPKTPVKVPLPRCQSVRFKKNTSAKTRQSGGSKTRTEHFIYVLPDLHPFLETFDDRDPDDPSPYLLVTWETDLTKPGETSANKSPSTSRVRGHQTVPGTIMIPCRTALRGNFPLNATHFQANEVFADWQTSQMPLDIPLRTLDGCLRKKLYCGSSLTSIVKGCSANDICSLFHEGYLCTRSFDRETYATRALDVRLHKSTNTKKRPFKYSERR